MKKFIWIILIGIALVIAACGSIYENEPVGIGRDYSELKKSPCACLEVKKAYALPNQVV